MKHYKDFLLYEGGKFSIYFHAERKGSSGVNDYFEKCDRMTQASLLHLAKIMGEKGRIYDQAKFRIEDRDNKIYAFKPKNDRFFCFFFDGKKIIITSAYRKRRQKLDKRELGKAIKIRNMYNK